jgi:hypothetical protein
MYYALCTMYYVCTMHYALCIMYVLCTMYYALDAGVVSVISVTHTQVWVRHWLMSHAYVSCLMPYDSWHMAYGIWHMSHGLCPYGPYRHRPMPYGPHIHLLYPLNMSLNSSVDTTLPCRP